MRHDGRMCDKYYSAIKATVIFSTLVYSWFLPSSIQPLKVSLPVPSIHFMKYLYNVNIAHISLVSLSYIVCAEWYWTYPSVFLIWFAGHSLIASLNLHSFLAGSLCHVTVDNGFCIYYQISHSIICFIYYRPFTSDFINQILLV